MYDILCAGVSCLDIVVSGNVSPKVFNIDSTAVSNISIHTGGDASNQAVTAASLGLKTGLISCIGSDWKGQQLKMMLQAKGVDTSLVETYEGESTVSSIVLVGDDGARNFMFDRGCGASYTPFQTAIDAVKQCKLLSIGSFFVMPRFDHEGVEALLKVAKEAGVITVADMTCDTMMEGFTYIGKYLHLIDFLMPSYDEAKDITGEEDPTRICQIFKERGANNVIVKMGSQGCFISTQEGDSMVPAYEGSQVIDTTGCGDTFVASFCYGLVKGKTIDESAVFAHAAAGINASYIGASGHIQSSDQVEDFLKKNK